MAAHWSSEELLETDSVLVSFLACNESDGDSLEMIIRKDVSIRVDNEDAEGVGERQSYADVPQYILR